MLRQGAAGSRSVVRVEKTGGQLHVWFCPQYRPRVLAGSIGIDLTKDALRYGQDLVGELIDRALRMADRRTSRAEAGQGPAR